ncbi:MAG TPA: hypothetical protein VJP77_05525 [Planctomycetota bacterium]|nr:hypothetical protein [Planctomycetota bacterium]
MLTPKDKIDAGGNRNIQVVVTTGCDLFRCSNCTQLLPFRRDYRHMTLDCFREAVASLSDWPGVVALFGGNPCVHPRFPELCAILAAAVPPARRGLWTNNLRDHGKIAAETFGKGVLNLNAHGDMDAYRAMDRFFPGRVIRESGSRASWHSPILLAWADLGVTRAAWEGARESCDLNREWSAAIKQGPDGKPRAYFCEVAASIDGIRGTDNGVPAVPGWWKAPMAAYEGQVKHCCDAGCGVPLRRLGHLDKDATYDVSPSWLAFMKPATAVETVVHHELPAPTANAVDYLARKTEKPLA